MGLQSFIHKIKIGFARKSEPAIPNTTDAKRYGSCGEDQLVRGILLRLPEVRIKKNIIIQTAEGKAEIDCLALYRGKLFAIEIKRWRGVLVDQGDQFVQYKKDRWTEDIYQKAYRSPFRQLNRAIYLLKKQIPERVWINGIVFFEEADSIRTDSKGVWFDDIDDLIEYMTQSGREAWEHSAESFFERCISADRLYSHKWGDSLYAIVCEPSVRFSTPNGVLTKRELSSITIKHHWCYDDLHIKKRNGESLVLQVENGSVYVNEHGTNRRYALSKLDYIEFGG